MIGATAWFGVPCSTFVFMSRSHTKRSCRFPKGNCKGQEVRRANLIVDRVAFLIKILSLRKVYWIMEQPLNSLLWVMPAIARAKKNMSGSRIGLAAPLPLDGALRTCAVEADGVSWSVPGDGISLANEAPSEARYLFGLPLIC